MYGSYDEQENGMCTEVYFLVKPLLVLLLTSSVLAVPVNDSRKLAQDPFIRIPDHEIILTTEDEYKKERRVPENNKLPEPRRQNIQKRFLVLSIPSSSKSDSRDHLHSNRRRRVSRQSGPPNIDSDAAWEAFWKTGRQSDSYPSNRPDYNPSGPPSGQRGYYPSYTNNGTQQTRDYNRYYPPYQSTTENYWSPNQTSYYPNRFRPYDRNDTYRTTPRYVDPDSRYPPRQNSSTWKPNNNSYGGSYPDQRYPPWDDSSPGYIPRTTPRNSGYDPWSTTTARPNETRYPTNPTSRPDIFYPPNRNPWQDDYPSNIYPPRTTARQDYYPYNRTTIYPPWQDNYPSNVYPPRTTPRQGDYPYNDYIPRTTPRQGDYPYNDYPPRTTPRQDYYPYNRTTIYPPWPPRRDDNNYPPTRYPWQSNTTPGYRRPTVPWWISPTTQRPNQSGNPRDWFYPSPGESPQTPWWRGTTRYPYQDRNNSNPRDRFYPSTRWPQRYNFTYGYPNATASNTTVPWQRNTTWKYPYDNYPYVPRPNSPVPFPPDWMPPFSPGPFVQPSATDKTPPLRENVKTVPPPPQRFFSGSSRSSRNKQTELQYCLTTLLIFTMMKAFA